MPLIVGSVGVQLVPDATGFQAKARSALRDLNVKVVADLDDDKAKAELEDVTRPRKATIDANADTAEADRKLDEAARTRSAKINVDKKSLSDSEHGLSTLTALAIGLGPALIPVAAGVTGIVAALAAPLAAAGAGAGLYAFIAGKEIKNTQAQTKAIAALKSKMDAAQQSLDQASTKSSKKSAAARLAQDTLAYDQALKKLSPEQQKFIKAEGALSGAFDKLVTDNAPEVFKPLVAGMSTLDDILPHLSPLLDSTSGALDTILRDIDHSVTDGSLNSFIRFFSQASGPAITGFASILGHLGGAFAGMARDFAPLSGGLLSDLDKMTGRFSKWTNSDPKAFQSFISYLHTEGPPAAHALGQIAKATGEVVKAAAPLGGPILKDLGSLASIIGKIAGSKAGTPLLAGLGGLVLTSKASSLLAKHVPGWGSRTSSSALGTVLGDVTGRRGVGTAVYVTNWPLGFGKTGTGGTTIIPTDGTKSETAQAGRTATRDIETGVDAEVTGSLLKRFGGKVGGKVLGEMAPDFLRIAGRTAMGVDPIGDLIYAGGDSVQRPTSGLTGRPGVAANDLIGSIYTIGNIHGRTSMSNAMQQAVQANPLSVGRSVAASAQVAGVSYPTYMGALLKQYPELATAAKAYGVELAKQTQDQASLNKLLLAPAIPNYAKRLAALPKAVQTKIETPGAVDSMAAAKQLAHQYGLTPKQLHTVVQLTGVSSAMGQLSALQRIILGVTGTKHLDIEVTRHTTSLKGLLTPSSPKSTTGKSSSGHSGKSASIFHAQPQYAVVNPSLSVRPPALAVAGVAAPSLHGARLNLVLDSGRTLTGHIQEVSRGEIRADKNYDTAMSRVDAT